jgi:tight adherence protein B
MITAAIAGLFALSIGGLGWVAGQALQAGMQSYAAARSRSLSRQFEDVFLFVPSHRIAELGWAAAVAAFVLFFLLAGNLNSVAGVLSGLFFGTLAGALALRSPDAVVALLRARRLARFNAQLSDTLVGMSNALKAGFSILQAFETVARDGENPIAQEFDVFIQETRVGVPFSDALEHMERRVGSEDLTLVVAAIEAARRTGGNLTEIFEKIAATIRERTRIEGRIRTLTAQGRLQGLIVGIMPLIVALALLLVDPRMMVPFFRSTIGEGVVLAVLTLIALGGLLIRRIVNIRV